MKTAKRIILIILLVLLIAIVSLGIWQRENIKSFINSIKYTEDEISNMMEENNKKMDDIVETTDYIDIRKGGLNAEEQAAVASGEITSEEAVEIVRGKTTLEEIREKKKQESEKLKEQAQEKPPEQTQEKPPETTKEPEKVPEKEPEKKPEETPATEMTDEVSNIVAELYVIKADFISRLEEIGEQMYYEYTKITRYDRSQIESIINKNLPTVATLERECDTKINKLLKDLEDALKKGGGDFGIGR